MSVAVIAPIAIDANPRPKAHPIKPRAMQIPVDADVPRHWAFGTVLGTHIGNGVNLLFPMGERFFIRSVRRYMDRIDDEELRAQIKGFFGQEGRHSHAHEQFFTILENQGYSIRTFLRIYEQIAFEGIEKISPAELCLSATAAAEHFTAIMAENALTEGFLPQVHPVVRDLLMWHAAEEIEHKSVAFDVLKKVNPSYELRIAGLIVAATLLGGFWAAATLMLLAQEDLDTLKKIPAELEARKDHEPIAKKVFVRGIKAYLRRDFHPSQLDNMHLATEYLASVGMS
ncbi:MAG: metal-dependent hydrolase [Polyangiaceae bacterium]